MQNPIKWVWVPKKSVGPLRFGERLPDGENGISFEEFADDDDEDNEQSFDVVGDRAQVYLEDGVIDYVQIWTSILFESEELIGKPVQDVIDIVECDWKIEHKGRSFTQIECDELGITLWEDEGIVESVTVGAGD